MHHRLRPNPDHGRVSGQRVPHLVWGSRSLGGPEHLDVQRERHVVHHPAQRYIRVWMHHVAGEIVLGVRSLQKKFGLITAKIQVLTLRVPFAEWATPTVISLMRQGKLYLPRRSASDGSMAILDDGHWALIQECWAENPIDRPTVEEVSAHVQWFYARPQQQQQQQPTPMRSANESGSSANSRRPRLLRRRSILVEDERDVVLIGDGGMKSAPGRVRSSSFSLPSSPSSSSPSTIRPRSIVDDNESSDDECLDRGMRRLRM